MAFAALSLIDQKYKLMKDDGWVVGFAYTGAVLLDACGAITLTVIAALGYYNYISLPPWGIVLCSVGAGAMLLSVYYMAYRIECARNPERDEIF